MEIPASLAKHAHTRLFHVQQTLLGKKSRPRRFASLSLAREFDLTHIIILLLHSLSSALESSSLARPPVVAPPKLGRLEGVRLG